MNVVMSAALITETLEHASTCAQSDDELFTRAYDLFYSRHPHFKEMFIMDDDGSVRGSMLQTALEYILLYVEDDPTLTQQMRGACANHQGYGVEAQDFTLFFAIIRDCVAAICTEKWQPPHAQAWQTMLAHFETLIKD